FRREDGPWAPESLSTLAGVGVVIRLSEAVGRLGVYPCVEPLTSCSRLLESSAVGLEHLDIPDRVRQALRLLGSDAARADRAPSPPGRPRRPTPSRSRAPASSSSASASRSSAPSRTHSAPASP